MPDCRYCEAAFENDDAYVTHLQAEHYDELGSVDRRRVDAATDDDESGLPTAPIVLGLVLVAGVGVLAASALLSAGGGSGADFEAEQQPSAHGSVHSHGTIEMVVDGERVDFSRDRYQLQADAFHFEGGEGTRWHVHAQGVTLEYAMATLGFDVTTDSVTYEGTTYRNSAQGTTVTVTVGGEPVVPSDYVLQDGDRVRIGVEQ